jgi:hypothetical protein
MKDLAYEHEVKTQNALVCYILGAVTSVKLILDISQCSHGLNFLYFTFLHMKFSSIRPGYHANGKLFESDSTVVFL